MVGRLKKLLSAIAGFTWWTVPPVVIATQVDLFAWSLPVTLVYIGCNAAGVWVFCDAHGRTSAPRLQLALKVLTIFLLPTFVAGFGPGTRQGRPIENSTIDSPDPEIRAASARTFRQGTP